MRLLLTQASVLERGGRARDAAAALEQAATVHDLAGEADEAAALRTARAGLLCRSGRAVEAVAGLEPAVATRPRSAQLRVALAAALHASGAPERAAAELRALLVLDPAQPDALAVLAAILVDLAEASPGAGERLEEAEGLARRAVELRPGSPAAHDALGRVRSARGDHAGAVSALERAVTLSSREARVLDDLGEAYRAAGRPREAAAAWRRALASAADEPPAVAERMRAALQRKLRGAGRVVAEHGPGAAPAHAPKRDR